MYMNLKPNQHKKISFNTTTMTSLGFIGPPQNLRSPLKFSFPPNLIFCSGPPQLFWSEIFRSPPKIGRGGEGGCYHEHVRWKVLLKWLTAVSR